jgi:hypothetical protein|nr:MAG TPA: hypothetical protein [Bacteriophage sp.]
MESILTSIKKLLGILEEYEAFDEDLIININSVFVILNQIGVGSPEIFSITSKDDTWNQFTKDNKFNELVKSYVHMRVKLMFDPPQSSSAVESTKKLIDEMEWRLYVESGK